MRRKIKSKCLAHQLIWTVKITNLIPLRIILCNQVFFPWYVTPLMKNQWNWYKPGSAQERVSLLNRAFWNYHQNKFTLQCEYHSFERDIRADRWISLLSSLFFGLLILLGLLSGTWLEVVETEKLLEYWGKSICLWTQEFRKGVSIYTWVWVQPSHSDQGPK